MNKKISQFEVTTSFEDTDVLTLVQNKTNKIIHKDDFNTSLSGTFATNERVDKVEDDVAILDTKVDTNYTDLSNKIVEGDTNVTTNINSTLTSYYDVLNNKIVTLEIKHDTDISGINGTVQEWIDDIDNRSTLQQLQDALNRLTVTENLVTALAELIANGGGSGEAPGFHTQPTSTIFPLSGYYKTGNTSPLTTTDTLNQALGKLESKIDSLETSGGMMPVIRTGEYTKATDSNLYTAAKSREENISRLYNDTVTGYLTFLNGMQWGPQFGPKKDFMGVGASMYKEGSKWNLDVDNLFVRGEMTVNELVVNQIKAVGGEILVTVADMKCEGVVEYDEYWRCYLPEDVDNQFRVLDQAICQKFDGKNVKRYWRLVINVGTDENGSFIDLSKYDKEESSNGIPEPGDNIIQLGNREDASRQSAIKISAKGSNGPSITMYNDIVDYSLDGKAGTTIGRDSTFVGTIMQKDYNGDLIRVPIDKGQYIAGNRYYYYDRVSYMGSLWLCMAQPWTEEAPSKDKPYVWQLQVEKGDAGNPASDVAKWVEITGQHLFFYETPDFTGTPDPTQLTLDCNVYGIENPSFEWKIKETGTVISTYKQCNFTPDLFGDNKYVTLRCTVISGDDTFYDEQQVGKVGNGAQGEDAYYIDLSNSNMTVPFDSSGNNPLIDLSEIYTFVYVYKGKELQTITDITAELVEGNGSVAVYLPTSKVILTSLYTRSARFKITVTVNGLTFTKDLWINQSNSGENGMDGVDAAYVLLSGEHLFHYYKETPLQPSPATITLYATPYNILDPVFQWYWSPVDTEEWTLLDGEFGMELVVDPNASYFLSLKEVKFKVVCKYSNSSVEYFDIITVSKIFDGVDGTSAYVAYLSNENDSIPATYSGSVLQSEVNKISTDFELWYGNEKVSDYTVRRIKPDSSNTSEVTPTTVTITGGLGNKTITLSSMDPSKDKAIFKIEFVVGGEVVAVRDFTITKQKGGKPGDFDVLLYGYRSSQPSSRPNMGKIGVPTSAGVYDSSNGMTWKLDIPSGSPIWMTKSTYTANEDGTVTSTITDGYYWTMPIKVTGEKGDKGDKGDQGANGTNGSNGAPGEVGQVQTYRGDWSSGTNYYLDRYRADVVSVVDSNGNRTFYRRIGQYTGTTVAPPNSSWWTSYGANFQSVATGLLFAPEADIAGWKFKNDYIYSQGNNVRLDGRSGQSVRIALGSSAATNPGGAPLRLLDDGSIVATKATITGSVTANTGKIGNYEISNGWLKTTQTGGGSAGYFSINNSNTKIRFGDDLVPSTAGGAFTLTAEIQNANPGASDPFNYTANTALLLTAAGSAARKIALQANGFINNFGGLSYLTANFTNGGTTPGTAGHTTVFPYQNIRYQNEFVFQPSANINFNLPTVAQMQTAFGTYPAPFGSATADSYIYHMTLTNIATGVGALYVRGVSGAPLMNQSGGIHHSGDYTYGQTVLNRGCSVKVTYFNRHWYISGGWGNS